MVIRRGCQPCEAELGCDSVRAPAPQQWCLQADGRAVLQAWGFAGESPRRCGPWCSSPVEGCIGDVFTFGLTLSSWETCCLLGEVGGAGIGGGGQDGGGSPFHPYHRMGHFDSTDSFNKLPLLFSDEKL